ncbi:hypothetical protein [Noviherbaspirillum malthae]|jgi:hypothetical protein|uniref:hypothetical protein n=1 Tax=Noviherbaspirillum malthae TaxID=1260987 RepID=UPI00188E3995|nr:hypothetical protein [Noviherbaspirillum malthae]
MLTATYSIIAIAAEQDKARHMLGRLQQHMEAAWRGLQRLDFASLDSAFNRLMHFDQFCRGRKIERYLMPTLRRFGRDAELLVAELEIISAKASGILRLAGEQLSSAFDLGIAKAGELCDSFELYCRHASVRLDREERELLPLARRLLTVEDWFGIAAQCLSETSRPSKGRQARNGVQPLHADRSSANYH